MFSLAKNPFSNTTNKKTSTDDSLFQAVLDRSYQRSVESRRTFSPAPSTPYQSKVETAPTVDTAKRRQEIEARLKQIETEYSNATRVLSDYQVSRVQNSNAYTTAKNMADNLKAEKSELERELKSMKTYNDDFFGQFGASFTRGNLQEDESLAWNEYIKNPTEANKQKAQSISDMATNFQKNNEAALDDDATAPLISQSLAGYLPQLLGQTKASAVGGVAGGAAGAAVGSVVPVLGTAAGAGYGIKAGIVAGSGKYSYDTMRGAAYKGLIDSGVPEDVAIAAANDEAVLSALIEMADTGWDIATFGVGSLINTITKGGTKAVVKATGKEATEQAAKRLMRALGKYGKNIAGEYAEEYAQETISMANQQRDSGGFGDLAAESIAKLFTMTDEEREQAHTAGMEGAKIGMMMGGATSIATNTANTYIQNKQGKVYNADIDALIDEGLQSDPSTEAFKLATQAKATRDSGGNVSNIMASKLADANQRAINWENAKADYEAQQTVDNSSPVVESSVETAPVQSRVSTIQTRLAESGMEATKAETAAKSIDRILSGDTTITNKDKDVLSVGNAVARTIFEEETGVKLPASNSSTRKTISEYVAQAALKQQKQESTATVAKKETVVSQPPVNVMSTNAVNQLKDRVAMPTVTTNSAEAALRQAAEAAATRSKVDNAATVQSDMTSLGTNGQRVYQKHLGNAKSVTSYSNAFQRYYDAGQIGLPFESIKTAYDDGADRGVLYEAYSAGQNDASVAQKGKPTITNKSAQKGKKKPSNGKGRFYDNRVNATGNTVSKETETILKQFARVFNVDIELVDSIADSKGRSIANGYYHNGKIVLAADSDNPLITVLKHEVTHHLQKTSPKQYKAFKDYVMKAYYQNSQDAMNAEIQRRIDLAALNKVKLTRAEAMDEIVADATESFLTDRDSIDALVRENRSLAETILNAIRDVLKKIEAAMKGEKLQGYSDFMNADQLKQAEKMWVEALAAAAEGSEVGVNFAEINESSAPIWSLKSMKFDLLDGQMQRDLVEHGIMTVEESQNLMDNISKLIDDMSPFARIVDMNEEYSKGNRPFNVYKPNSDPLYKVSLDFSTLCKKRLMTQFVMESLQTKLGKALSAKEQLAIRSKLEEYGKTNQQIQVACALCYVEARRLKAPDQINRFLDDRTTILTDYFGKKNKEYKASVDAMADRMKVEMGYEADTKLKDLKSAEKKKINEAKQKMMKQYIPTAEEQKIIERANAIDNKEFLSQAGLTNLSLNDPVIYDAFVTHVRNATKSKALEGGVPYYYGDSKSVSDALIEAMNAENGLRHQSWSDFEIVHLLDNIAAVIELSVRKAKMHAYTKVPDFVKVNGKTGIMINLSLIPAGKTGIKDGKLDFSPTEGMDYAVAVDLRDQYHKTTGTIAIGIDDQQITMMLDDDTIDYVIPYHTSGMNAQLRKMAGISGWADYESFQSEKEIKGAEQGDCPDELWHKKPDFSEWFDTSKLDMSKSGVEIMREAAGRYLVLCEERGLKPKFSDTKKHTDFSKHENYWKLLIDRKMVDKDGNIIIQQTVRPDFDFDLINQVVAEEVANYDPTLLDSINERISAEWESGDIKKREKELLAEEKKAKKAKKKAAKVANGLLEQVVSSEDVQFNLKGYTPIREKLAKAELDKLSDKLGEQFPLSARFDSYMKNTTDVVSSPAIKADSVQKGNKSYYKAAKDEFIKCYKKDETVNMAGTGVVAKLDAEVANESMAKRLNRGDEQVLLDIIPRAKNLIEGGKLFGIERIAHTGNKKSGLFAYRVYNAFDYETADPQTKKATTTPYVFVATVVQQYDGDSVVHIIRGIEIATYDRGKLGKSEESSAITGGKYKVSHLYKYVKDVPRESGGLKYTPQEELDYAFHYTETEDGRQYSFKDSARSMSVPDVINSLYNYDTVKFDKVVVDWNTEDFEEKWDRGYYTSVVETIAQHTGKSRQEVWNAFADVLMKKDGIAKVDGKTYINVHELSEDSLRKAFELGGLAAPSIGIVDIDKPTTNFGRISLIFPDIFNPETVPTHYGDSYSTSLPAVAKFTDSTALEDALTDGFEGMEYSGILSAEEMYDLIRDLEQFYIYDERQRTSHAISENGFRNAKEFARNYSVKGISGLRKLYDGLSGNYESYEQFLEDFAEKAFTNQRLHKYHTYNPDFDWNDRLNKFRAYTLDDAVEEMTARGDDDFSFSTAERVTNYDEMLSAGMRARLKASSTGYYEAKPQRAVYIGEATYAVVPESTSEDVIDMLEYEGVKVVKYQGIDGVTDGKVEAIKGILEGDTTGIRYQLKTPEEMADVAQQIRHKAKAVTDAEIMTQAVKDLKMTTEERTVIRNYQNAMKTLADYEQKLAVYEATKAEHGKGRSFYTDASGKVKKSGVKYSAAERAEIQRKVEWWKKQLREIEQRENFQKILKREKAKMAERHAKEVADIRAKYDQRLSDLRAKRDEKVEAEKQKMRDYKQFQRDSKEYKALKSKLEADVKWLDERLRHPTDAKHIPEEFKKGVSAFLLSLDFESEYTDRYEVRNGRPSQKVIDLRAMREVYEKILKDQSSTMELDEIQLEALRELEKICANKRVADLDYAELGLVRDAIQYIKMSVTVADKAFNKEIKESISSMGEALIQEQRSKKTRKDHTGIVGGADKLLNFDNVAPADKFHEFGGVMEKLYHEIRKGFDSHISNVQSAIAYTQNLIKGKEEAIKEWSGKKAKTTKFQISDGTTIELTPAQVMSLYCLMKREQALGHIIGSGIVPSGVEVKDNKRIGKVNLPATKKLYSDRASRCTLEDIQKIVSTLTADQKRVADGVAKFFTTKCADWGNETSMKLYGYKKFNEANYFPIKSSDAYLNARFDDSGDVLIKNLGFTKNTVVNANNPIVIEDIFDVLADHTNKMSMYNALVVPLTDFTRVFNYKSKASDNTIYDSVQKALEASGGNLGIQYIKQFMKDINKQANSLAAESFINQSISRYKKAKIAASARVLLQQPTAITRAAAMVDPKYLIKGLQQKANYEEMFDHSEIAYWKSLGFYQTDMGRNMKDILLDNESPLDRMTMGVYGKADDFAWGHLWNSIKLEQADAHPDMDTTSSEFLNLVAERFDEVVDRTQVVDSVFHRSQIMRAQGAATKVATAFMSEPTKAFNLLRTDLIDSIDSKDYSKIKRSVATYVANAVLVAAFAGIADMIRDDEDEDDEGEKRNLWDKYRDATAKNIVSNINPMGMIPYIKEISSMIQGYDVNRMEMASLAEFVKTAKKWTQGKYSYPYLIKETAEDISELFGIPLKNAIRDVTALVRTAGDIVGGYYYEAYMVDKMKYNISNSANRSVFYKHYTDALLAGDEAAADKILMDMVINGIPYDNIISKGYQAEKDVAFSEARKLIATGKADEAKSLIKKLAKKYGKKYTTLWKAVKNGDSSDVPEETYDFKDLSSAVRKGEDTELIEEYLTEYGGYSEEDLEEAIKLLTEKYK